MPGVPAEVRLEVHLAVGFQSLGLLFEVLEAGVMQSVLNGSGPVPGRIDDGLVERGAERVELVPVEGFLVGAKVLAQLLQIIGTLHSNTLVSSVLMLVGNLGMSLTLDYVFYGTFSLLRAAGLLLILLGMTWVEKEKHAPAESEE